MTGWLAALVLANALDAGSTCRALDRGAREANPLLPRTCAGIVATKTVTTGIELPALLTVDRSHPTAARWLAVVVIAIPTVATIHTLAVTPARRP